MKIAQIRKFIMREEEEAGSEVRVGGTEKTICAIIATSLDTGQKSRKKKADEKRRQQQHAPSSNNPRTWEA